MARDREDGLSCPPCDRLVRSPDVAPLRGSITEEEATETPHPNRSLSYLHSSRLNLAPQVDLGPVGGAPAALPAIQRGLPRPDVAFQDLTPRLRTNVISSPIRLIWCSLSFSGPLPHAVSNGARPTAILECLAQYSVPLDRRGVGRPIALLVLAGTPPDTHRQLLVPSQILRGFCRPSLAQPLAKSRVWNYLLRPRPFSCS